MIKNVSLIINDEKTSKEHKIIIRRKSYNLENRDTKLGDVLEFLPSGLIVKEETGLGATTLELMSKRNSIIVEPIKITASSKAYKHSKDNEEALYVGSETLYHKGKKTDNDISAYINNNSIRWKKILVVADSLYRVVKAIGAENFKDYFLMIDEIDSFQLDSYYRKSMDECLDVYKIFPKKNRAMVSATSLAFSDPILVKEPRTTIKYDVPTIRTINLYASIQSVHHGAITRIGELLEKFPKDKLLIAYNSVSGCYSLAQHLNKHNGIAKADIKILCSNSSKDKIEEYYVELNSETLPGKIDFITSAYFSGFDLSERYHLISISSALYRIYSLSTKRLKQISGRCRDVNGLLSESVIYDMRWEKDTEESYSKKTLINIAKNEIAALNCISQNYSSHPLLKANLNTIRELITQHTATNGYRYVRMKDQKPVISYLTIDAYIDTMHVREKLYQSIDKLPKVLRKEGHIVNAGIINMTSLEELDLIVKEDITKEGRNKQIKAIIEKLRAIDDFDTLKEWMKKGKGELSGLQNYIVSKYLYFFGYIEKDNLLTQIQQTGEHRDSRALKNLFHAAYYYTLDAAAHYKRLVTYHIPIGQMFTGEGLRRKWNLIFAESGLSRQLSTPTQAIKFTKLHFHTIRKRHTEGKHYIAGENPFKLRLIKHKPYKESRIQKQNENFSIDL